MWICNRVRKPLKSISLLTLVIQVERASRGTREREREKKKEKTKESNKYHNFCIQLQTFGKMLSYVTANPLSTSSSKTCHYLQARLMLPA